ncbi:MAG: hypothetical protein ABIH26_10725 [Candidatus Eisenbacteria bacterium]
MNARLSVSIAALLVGALSAPCFGVDLTTFPLQDVNGVFASAVPLEDADAATPGTGAEAFPGGRREATILWHRHWVDPIYTSMGINEPSAMVVAGTYLNAPMHVEATSLLGDGTEEWTYGGTQFYVDASANGEVIAAVDFHPSDSTATIMEWRPGSSTPLWSYVVRSCRPLTYAGWASRKPIRVSEDGSTIAAAITIYTPSGLRGYLIVFEPGIGPVSDYALPSPAGSAAAIEVSANGDYVAVVAWPMIFVYDRYAETLRWSGSVGAGNDALAISGDGRYLTWGWSTFYLREWNGSSYAPLWTHTPGAGLYVGQCALAADNSALAVSWDNGNSFPNTITLDLYDLPSLDLAWRYEYGGGLRAAETGASSADVGERQHVDIQSQMRFAPDGERLTAASWGGSFPEIHVFDRSEPGPLFTLDTPGSMFDIAIVTNDSGDTWVSACGKGVHAGQSGRGGDLYAIEIPGISTGLHAGGPARSAFGLLANSPNPFNPETRIAYSLDRAGAVHVGVCDTCGRLVKDLLDGFEGAGERSLVWNATNESGNPVPSGVYLVRLRSGEKLDTRKVLLLR